MSRQRERIALSCGALLLAGCVDLDRQLLGLGSYAMLGILVAQSLVMLAALQSPSTSGWRTLGLVVAAIITVPGMLCAVLAVAIYAGRRSWPATSTLDLAFVLYGAAALVAMAVRVAVWNTPGEPDQIASDKPPPQPRAFRIAVLSGVTVATAVLAALLIR